MRSDVRTKQLVLLVVMVVAAAFYLALGANNGSSRSNPRQPSFNTEALAISTSTISTTTTSTTTVSASSTVPPAPSTTLTPSAPEVDQAGVDLAGVDLVGDEPGTATPCTIPAKTMRAGASGDAVVCLQNALIANGYLSGTPSGVYDTPTNAAIVTLQTEKKLFVDGVVGRETGLALNVWPDEQLRVVRTPPPPEGAVDLLGFKLSSVASTGASAPPLPANSGSGRRLVFDRAGQRTWAVNKNGEIIRSWLVSGSLYNNELPGTHKVYSKSAVTTAWNGQAFLEKMVRWLKTDIGAIGFHQIPVRRSDGTVYQTEEELGTRLSGGCQRQAKLDADFLWKFATIGTPVVVT
jgi:hypothetical protein